MAARIEGTSVGTVALRATKKQRTEKTTTFNYFTRLNDDMLIKISQFIPGRLIARMAGASRHWAMTLLPSIKLDLQASLLQDFTSINRVCLGFMQQIEVNPVSFSFQLENYDPLIWKASEVFLSRLLINEDDPIKNIPLSLLTTSQYFACSAHSLISESRTAANWAVLANRVRSLYKSGYFIPAVQAIQFISPNLQGNFEKLGLQLLEEVFEEIFKPENKSKFLQLFKLVANEGSLLIYKIDLIQKLMTTGDLEIAALAIENLPAERQGEHFEEIFTAFLQKGKIEQAKEVAKKLPEQTQDLLDIIDSEDYDTEVDLLNIIRNVVSNWSENSYVQAKELAEKIYDCSVRNHILKAIETARDTYEQDEGDDVDEGDFDEGDELY